MKVVLGIDPGLRNTGWGVVGVDGNRLTHIAHGVVVSSSNLDLSLRLVELFKGLEGVINTYSPTEAAVEETFVNKNPTSTLKLGMARGVVLMAPALFNVSVFEYTANKVKKAVVGVGHATKDQVSHMVQVLLPKSAPVSDDAADALAVALCHCNHTNWNHGG